jgi:hypothetical protein
VSAGREFLSKTGLRRRIIRKISLLNQSAGNKFAEKQKKWCCFSVAMG